MDEYDVKDLKFPRAGKEKVEWTGRHMPVVKRIRKRFSQEKPLQSVKIACCLHVTTETANLMLALKAGGAKVSLCASNPLSTQDEVAVSLVEDYNIPVFAKKGEDKETYYSHIDKVLSNGPNITMDDGADLVSRLHQFNKKKPDYIWGGSEETTTGVVRLRSLQKNGKLLYPIIAVNDAYTKHLFDNRFGTGQSTIDGIIRATDMLIAGKNFVVSGYGWCGKGIALRAKGMGANVIVTEVDPTRALEAVMEGFNVMCLEKACRIGDIFITSTGNIDVIRGEHFELMKDGAILANAGHFNVEIDVERLEEISKEKSEINEYIEEYVLDKEKRIYLLGQGRLVNLVAATGHPPSVMDMSFANQALCCEYITKEHDNIHNEVLSVPAEIDKKVASLKLKNMGIEIDKLSNEQRQYLSSWEMGT